MPYSPTPDFYVPGTIRTSAFPATATIRGRTASAMSAAPRPRRSTRRWPGPSRRSTAKTNKIAWQHKTPYRMGGGGGSTVTAGGLVLRGEPDGNFLALDAKTGEELFRFQTGFGADAPPVVYEVDGSSTSPS